ncbi:MAG: YtxH domain-containing protein [Campylobacterales bacterium]
MQQNQNNQQNQNMGHQQEFGYHQNPNNMPSLGNPYINRNHNTLVDTILGKSPTERFIRGAAIGALATYLLTNENAQKAIAKGALGLYEGVAGGMAEIKERFMDAKAEFESKEA